MDLELQLKEHLMPQQAFAPKQPWQFFWTFKFNSDFDLEKYGMLLLH